MVWLLFAMLALVRRNSDSKNWVFGAGQMVVHVVQIAQGFAGTVCVEFIILWSEAVEEKFEDRVVAVERTKFVPLGLQGWSFKTNRKTSQTKFRAAQDPSKALNGRARCDARRSSGRRKSRRSRIFEARWMKSQVLVETCS